MKILLSILLLFSFAAKAQDTTKYMPMSAKGYKFNGGTFKNIWIGQDTTNYKTGIVRIGFRFFVGNGVYWKEIAGGGSGTVTSVARTNGYAISASVANPTTTPNITIDVDSATLSQYYVRLKNNPPLNFNPFASNNIFYRDYAGVIKPTATATPNSPITWEFLDTTSNGVHGKKYGFDSVNASGNVIQVHYAPTKFIISFLVTPDESLAVSTVQVGSSVLTSRADIYAYRLTMNAGKLTGDTTTWTNSGLSLSVNSYNTSTGLTSITPTVSGGTILGASNEVEGTQISYVGTNNYRIRRQYSGLGGLIGFYLVENLTNNIVTGNLSSTDVVSIMVARPTTTPIPAQTVNSVLYPSDIYTAGANYWVRAAFELWFRAYPLNNTTNATIWQAYKIGSNFATNYRITRATLAAPTVETDIFNGYGFYAEDTTATAGVQYIYRMYATVLGVESLVTNEKCVTVN